MHFSIDPQTLIDIVSKYEIRTFAEEVDLLEHKGSDLSWLFTELKSDPIRGISKDPDTINERKAKFGTN